MSAISSSILARSDSRPFSASSNSLVRFGIHTNCSTVRHPPQNHKAPDLSAGWLLYPN
jgi:hypothetical protein